MLGKHHHPHWEGWRSQDEVKEINRNRLKSQAFKFVPQGNKNKITFTIHKIVLLSQLRMLFCIHQKEKKENLLQHLQLIHDDVWSPELLRRERNPSDAVTLIRVPNQELMVPVLQ